MARENPTSGASVTAAVRATPVQHDENQDNLVIVRSRTEPAHFAEIYDRHAAAIHGYLARRIGNARAEDLTADTFLTAFNSRGRYDPQQDNARPWLYGIATNLLRRERRSEVRQYRALARTGIDPVDAGEADSVVARVAAAGATRQLAAALASLSGGERDVLLLIAWEELSYADVARALDIPIGTVRSRLHSARTRMRSAVSHLISPDHQEHDVKE